jgi:hypothetical protein
MNAPTFSLLSSFGRISRPLDLLEPPEVATSKLPDLETRILLPAASSPSLKCSVTAVASLKTRLARYPWPTTSEMKHSW